jgi:hypothetical protein
MRRIDDYISQIGSDDENPDDPDADDDLMEEPRKNPDPPPRERSVFDDVDD